MRSSIRYLPLLLLCFVVPTMFAQDDPVLPVSLTGVYEYVYKYNTRDLIENHYLEFKSVNGKLEGYYYGTSDDFDEAREGYPVGFFSAAMKSLVVRGTSISFEIQVADSDMFSKPVTPLKKTEMNAPWDVGVRYTRRSYYGEIRGNIIIIKTRGFDERVFRKTGTGGERS